MEKFREMGTSDTGRLLINYSLPAIAGMLVISIYNVADRIFVGQATGAIGLAAVTVAFPVMMVGFSGAILANVGGSSLISRLLGTGDTAGAERALGQSVLLGTVLSTVVSLVCLPILDPMLRLFGASDVTLPAARQFSLLTLVSFPFQGASFGLAAGVRSQGKAKTSMLLNLAGVLANIGLCGWFVIGLGWGVAGSALATLIAQILSFLLFGLFYLLPVGALRFRIKNLAGDPAARSQIIRIGLGAFLMNIIPVVLFVILNNAAYRVAGDVGLAMIGIVNTLITFTMLPVFGIMQGAAPIMGYNHGAGDARRVWSVFFKSLGSSTLLLFVFWTLIELFPESIVRAFSADPQLLTLAKRCVATTMISLPLIGLPITLTQYYQSVGKALPAAVIGLSRQIIFLIPALLVMSTWWGLDGLIWAGPVADVLGLALTLVYFAIERREERTIAGIAKGSFPSRD